MKIKLIAPPLYVMITTALDKDLGIQRLNDAIAAVSLAPLRRTRRCAISHALMHNGLAGCRLKR